MFEWIMITALGGVAGLWTYIFFGAYMADWRERRRQERNDKRS